MVITFGPGFVGKVDRVAGKHYVVTRAFQVINVPLVPLGGYLVREGSEHETFVAGLREFDGIPLALSWRSFAWSLLRVGLFGGGLLTMLGMLVIVLGVHGIWALLLGPLLGLAMLVVWAMTRKGLRAKPARALELARLEQADRYQRISGAGISTLGG